MVKHKNVKLKEGDSVTLIFGKGRAVEFEARENSIMVVDGVVHII
jgi:hypothetical protein